MAASAGFGNLSNITAKLQNAVSKQLPQRCKDIEDVLRNSSYKELQNVVPWLLESIFGFGSEPGWKLDLINKNQQPYEFDAVMRLLAPEGQLLTLIYHLQADPYLSYEFPFNCLPSPTRHALEEGSMPLFYVNKIQYQNYSKPVIVLSAFEFYMFHFFYTLVNPVSQSRQVNWSNVSDMLYPCILDEYLRHFLPLGKKNLPKFPKSHSSPVRSPVVQQTSFLSERHSMNNTRGSARKSGSLGLLKSNLITPQKPLSQNSPVSDKTEIWWSETFIQVLAEFWLNQNSLGTDKTPNTSMMSTSWYGDSLGADPLSRIFVCSLLDVRKMKKHANRQERFSPSNNHVRLTRLVVKHIHTFVDSASPEIISSPYQNPDTPPLDEFKRTLVPQLLQKKVYTFLKHSFERWPLDSSFRLLLELWLTYIQPWRYPDETKSKPADTDNKDLIQETWFPFIRDNFLFYTVLFHEFLQRTKRMNLTSIHDAYMVFRVAKVFDLPNLPQFMREVEKIMYNCSFKTSHHDLGGSYIAPEMSMVLRVQIADLERPDFIYSAFFSQEVLQEVNTLLRQISSAMYTLESATPEKKSPEKSGFASFFNLSFFEDNSKAFGDLTGSEVKKLLNHLDQAFTDVCRVFGISVSQARLNQTVPLSPCYNPSLHMSANQSMYGHTGQLSSVPSTPDCEVTDMGPQLTPLGRYQIMNGIRKFRTFDAGDPDLQPIKSYENTFLVRLMYRVSSFINTQFNTEISSAYRRADFLGKLSQVYLAAPLRPGESPTSPVSREMAESLYRPRLSLRFLANYHTLLYLCIMYGMLYLGWGVGPFGYLLFLIMCLIVFGVFRALLPHHQVKVD